jgi:hypothetical protein
MEIPGVHLTSLGVHLTGIGGYLTGSGDYSTLRGDYPTRVLWISMECARGMPRMGRAGAFQPKQMASSRVSEAP